MTLIIDKLCRFYPDATREEVQEMLSRLDPSQITLNRPQSYRPEYHVGGGWLSRDHLKGCDNHGEYLARIDAFEQRLGAKLIRPRHTNWTFFGNVRGRTQNVHLGSEWTDHPAAFDGGDTRYLVTQPYTSVWCGVWQTCPKIDLARNWAAVMGFDTFEALDHALGFWNPPCCHVFVLTKKRP